MSKAIEENKQKFKLKRLAREFNLCWKFICTNKNNDKNKMNIHPSRFYPSYSFLNCWKTTKSRTLKFSDFQFVFINVLWKIKRNCISGFFCNANLWEAVRKKQFFKAVYLLQTKMKQNIPIINVGEKRSYRNDIETHMKPKSKEKIELRFAI